MKVLPPLLQRSDHGRSSSELRAVDCNLNSLFEHIQLEGFNSGSFSDVVVNAMGSTYYLRRLILSRSSYFEIWCFNRNLGVSFRCLLRVKIMGYMGNCWGYLCPSGAKKLKEFL
ncbi:hypothetical protein V6N13_083870 [Hibiscus sabdariffa]